MTFSYSVLDIQANFFLFIDDLKLNESKWKYNRMEVTGGKLDVITV